MSTFLNIAEKKSKFSFFLTIQNDILSSNNITIIVQIPNQTINMQLPENLFTYENHCNNELCIEEVGRKENIFVTYVFSFEIANIYPYLYPIISIN